MTKPLVIRPPVFVNVTGADGAIVPAKVDEVRVIEGHVWLKLEKRVTGFVDSKEVKGG